MSKKSKRRPAPRPEPELEIKAEIQAPAEPDALARQIGGQYYLELESQPITFILDNDLGYVEGRVVELMTIWRERGGIMDLEKAQHLLEIAIQHYKMGDEP